MNIEDKARDVFTPLNEVDLSFEDKEKLLLNIKKNMYSSTSRRKLDMKVFPSIAAAAAAIAIIAGGFSLANHSGHFTSSSDRPTTGSSSINNPVTPTSPIKKESYSSFSAANAQITNIMHHNSYLAFQANSHKVDLGLGIVAKQDGGLDHRGLQWHEGNWTVEVLWFGNNKGGNQIAKNMIKYLHSHTLPSPNNKGVIIVNSTDPNSTTFKPNTIVAWQEGKEVLTLQKPGNPVNALETVINSKR